MDKKYHIITYGCQMNEHDSEKMAGMLEEIGYQETTQMEEADLIILNTCCVRENAELTVYGKIGEIKRLKRQNPDLLVGIGGCMMQQAQIVEELYKKYPHVDFIFGTHTIHQLPEIISRVEERREREVSIKDQADELIPELPSSRENDYQAWVSIILGCNNFCTYCIVPYVRGRERSRPPGSILREVESLAADGVKEITLLGQNVNSYGKDLDEEINFAELLRRVDRVDGLRRIRYMTSHPRDFSPELITTIRDSDKICQHIHLPLQSGSSRILKKMNRGYTKEKFVELAGEIRAAMPAASITTDIIVGFPGETAEDFAETLDVIERVRFDNAFTFLYSPRTGTPAARMEEQVPREVQKERFDRLVRLQNLISREINESYPGKIVEVLSEGESKKDPERQMGRTCTNKVVIFPSTQNLEGRLVRVKIERVQTFTLFGKMLEIIE
ncbi:MAG: tRNA (N6-isopentenyl adenosine(37)-C2)-methylthiotransferase MiaB [Halanaerobium sp.]|nr:tRNA (N6-isopentenyl adenosine(37)-C2)-methylthiotransferase MiaB [Halanaerobium sp.]